MKSWLISRAKELLLLSVTALFCIFLGEMLIRFVVPQQLIKPSHHIWRPDSEIGWRHVENANAEINAGEWTVHFVTDGDGHRINYPPVDPGVSVPDLNVLAIGDSYIEAVSVENSNAIPQVLQRLLSSGGFPSVNVVNAGVGGWDPNQYLAEAKHCLSKAR